MDIGCKPALQLPKEVQELLFLGHSVRFVESSLVENNHSASLRQLNAHLQNAGDIQKRLSAAEYAEEVQRYLNRIRTSPAQPIVRRLND